MKTDCKVCTHPRAFEIMTKVFQGNLTYVDAAQELNLPKPTVWNCFAHHWEVVNEAEGVSLRLKDAQTPDDFIDILKSNIRLFIKRLESTKTLPISALNERAITSLSKELRGHMRDILEFEGKLTTGAFVQFNILQVQMTKLTSFLLSELCEVDRQKLLTALPTIIKEQEIAEEIECKP